jgi:diguanylate cyclase (GGDEF)-like protein
MPVLSEQACPQTPSQAAEAVPLVHQPARRPAQRDAESGLRWLYVLVALPMLTTFIQTGSWSRAPREWFTEIVIGLVIAALVRQVRKEHAAVLALARRDPLTGLWNRRVFEEAIEDECVRARRSPRSLSLVYIDLDHFKQVNDRDGHAQGDRVLQQLAGAMDQVIRTRVDRSFRLGGDEFALLLPGTQVAQAAAVLARIRQHCAHSDPVWTAGLLAISAGIVELQARESPAAFLQRADTEMYRQKALRRA